MSERFDYATERGLDAALRSAALDSDFPQYGYGLVQAVFQALALGRGGVSVLELGVAGGNGLVALERLCARFKPKQAFGKAPFEIAIAGFDLGTGMPEPVDYRDAPYVWQKAFFRMDHDRLLRRLRAASVVLGDVKDTGPAFLAQLRHPIGFIAFDLDFYSSTVSAFEALLQADPGRYLPRVLCYFDDTVGPHAELHCEHVGELLAIAEFNARNRTRKIARINGLQHKLPGIGGAWIEGMYALHIFEHPDYDRYIYPDPDRQFPLAPA